MKKYTQTELNKIFAAQSGEQLIKFKNLIWFNPTIEHSLRLTLNGYTFLINRCKLKSYVFDLEPPITNKLILSLERYYPSFYFIMPSQHKFYSFEDETTTLLILMNGNLKELLKNYEQSSDLDKK